MASVLPTSVWDQFSLHFRNATGLRTLLCAADGRVLFGEAAELLPCGAEEPGGAAACAAFYEKVAQQTSEGRDPMLLRCPHGLLVFGAPVVFGPADRRETAVLIGGAALPEGGEERGAALDSVRAGSADLPFVEPNRLLETARLAQFCLVSVIQGSFLQETSSQRQSQVLTLFEVTSDLVQTSSTHELYALALNILGVLFDVDSAAVLSREEGGDGFRVQTAMGSLEKQVLGWQLAQEDASALFAEDAVAPGHIEDPHHLGKLGLPEAVDRVSLYPLRCASRVQGFLLVVNTALTVAVDQMIRGLAVQLSVSLENRRLLEGIGERDRELDALRQRGSESFSYLDLDQLLRAILAEAQRMTGARKGSFMALADGDGEAALVVKAVSGMNERLIGKLRVRSGEGIAGGVLLSGEPLLVGDLERDGRLGRKNRPRFATKSFLSLPLRLEDRVLGVLNLADKASGGPFTESDLALLQGVTLPMALAIERSTFYVQNQELRRISITDSLTGLLNRRYFQERLAEEVDRATRHGHPMILVMMDIDHFKDYNDANGHPAGDRALVLVGRTVRSGIRTIDVVSRFGGEEFALILPETRKHEALEICERIRGEIERLYFPGEESQPSGRLTLSLGIAGFPEDAGDLKTLIQRADRALYRAKAKGRNTVVLYAEEQPLPGGGERSGSWTKVL